MFPLSKKSQSKRGAVSVLRSAFAVCCTGSTYNSALPTASAFSRSLPVERQVILIVSAVRRLLARSEEHTSELQSRLHLVCRLLLEKKKKKNHTTSTMRHDSPLHIPSTSTSIIISATHRDRTHTHVSDVSSTAYDQTTGRSSHAPAR